MVPFCLHAVANTPAGLMEFIRSYDSISFGLPTNRGGSAPALSVSGPAQRSLTLRPARSPTRLATLCTRGFSSLVASTAALIATGWSEPVPGRVYPRCGPPPFHGAPGLPTIQPAYTCREQYISLRVALLSTATCHAQLIGHAAKGHAVPCPEGVARNATRIPQDLPERIN